MLLENTFVYSNAPDHAEDEIRVIKEWMSQAEECLGKYCEVLNESNSKRMRDIISKSYGLDAVIIIDEKVMKSRLLPRMNSRIGCEHCAVNSLGIKSHFPFIKVTQEQAENIVAKTGQLIESTGSCEMITDMEFKEYFPDVQTTKEQYQVIFLCIDSIAEFVKHVRAHYNLEFFANVCEKYFHAKPNVDYFDRIMGGRLTFFMRFILFHEIGHVIANHNFIEKSWINEETEANFFGSICLFNAVHECYAFFVTLFQPDAYHQFIYAISGGIDLECDTFKLNNQLDKIFELVMNRI